MVRGGITYRLVTDHLGSLRQVVNTSTGVVAEQVEYDEFGNVLSDSDTGFVPFGFAGGLYDTHTKLVRFGARDYDASMGRWLVKDPIRFKGLDANLFAYTGNDPKNQFDPDGESAMSAAGDIVEAIISLATFDVEGAGRHIGGAFSSGVAQLEFPAVDFAAAYFNALPASRMVENAKGFVEAAKLIEIGLKALDISRIGYRLFLQGNRVRR